VTAQGALNYGVVMKADGKADKAATEKLREKLRAERKEVKLFDRGFQTIDELKGRCKAETGHEPPRQPRFSDRIMKKKAGKAA